ncbi:hypothetical protein V491_06893, partial [Pseudogymnoascus sp. VKM F-3775]
MQFQYVLIALLASTTQILAVPTTEVQETAELTTIPEGATVTDATPKADSDVVASVPKRKYYILLSYQYYNPPSLSPAPTPFEDITTTDSISACPFNNNPFLALRLEFTAPRHAVVSSYYTANKSYAPDGLHGSLSPEAAYHNLPRPRLPPPMARSPLSPGFEAKNTKSGKGGVWYIPDEWRKESDPPTTTILEAARLASKRAAERKQTIPHSSIPLIVHQTWMNTKIDEWAPDLVLGVERWLEYAMAEGKEGMAYFLWLDDGCDQLITDAEPDLVDILNALPLPVERSDVFRVVVANSIGGIYGDIDTHPLRSPASWLEDRDITPWTDPQTN